MKIKHLRFKNLNSLVGEWEIDFSSPEYQNEGIFAITGKTGAGKSTILDAICLALYGETPRLGKITKSTNEIMSRRTGECFSEVVFESSKGQFKCHFSQRRAKNQSDGELQSQRHEISDFISGEILESKIKDVQHAVIARIGMDFDQFTRSILLAQGGFAKFLTASSDERAPILEQITGTKIYSTISIKVHERNRDELTKLSGLQLETNSIQLLSEEEKTQLKLDRQQKTEEEKILKEKRNKIAEGIAWVQTIFSIEKDLQLIDQDEEKIKKDLVDFQPENNKLKNALQASELEGEYATITSVRNNLEKDQKLSKEYEENLPKIQEDNVKCKTEQEEIEKYFNKLKVDFKSERNIIKNVRELDLVIKEKNLSLQTYQKEIESIKENLEENNRKKDETKTSLSILQSDIDKLKDYLKDNSIDETLNKEFSDIEGASIQYVSLSNTLEETKRDNFKYKQQQTEIGDEISKQTAICETVNRTETEIKNKLQQIEKDIKKLLDGKLLREYRTEQTTLLKEQEYLHRILSLEEERKKLEDDKPCPLCGSNHHPYAKGNIPEKSKIDLRLEKLETLFEEIENKEEEKRNLETKILNVKEELKTEELKLSDIKSKKATNEANLEKTTVEFNKKQQEHNQIISKLIWLN